MDFVRRASPPRGGGALHPRAGAAFGDRPIMAAMTTQGLIPWRWARGLSVAAVLLLILSVGPSLRAPDQPLALGVTLTSLTVLCVTMLLRILCFHPATVAASPSCS